MSQQSDPSEPLENSDTVHIRPERPAAPDAPGEATQRFENAQPDPADQPTLHITPAAPPPPPPPPFTPEAPLSSSAPVAPPPSIAPEEAPLAPPPQPPASSSIPPFGASRSTGPDAQQILARMQQVQTLTARILYDLGAWVFGGLLIAALMLLQDIIPLGFADRATLIAGLTIALALPFNLAGLGIIRYFNTLKQAVEEARTILAQSANLDAEALIIHTRQSAAMTPSKTRAMDLSVSLSLYISIFFTIFAYSAAIWRVSWVATLLLLLAGILAILLLARAIRSA